MIDLDEATRALRSENDGSAKGAQFTRARVMRSLHERKHKRRVRWGFGIPLAVVFVGSTAFAGARGDLGPGMQTAVNSLRELLGGTPRPASGSALLTKSNGTSSTPSARLEAQAPKATPNAQAELAEPKVPPLSEEVAAHAESPSSPKAPARGPATPNTTASAAAAPANPPSAPTESDAATALYRKAHEAQFVQNDCQNAVAAYDAYLASAPHDRLVPEARYHRALCLVRLGRTEAAREALTPFADGSYGDLRRREARELLDALGTH